MSIGSALSKSISGLQGAQSGLSVISTNIASANTAGYVRRELQLTDSAGVANAAPGVQAAEIVRALDVASQNLMRWAATQDGEAKTLNDSLQQLDAMMGGPGSDNGIDAAYREFSAALVTASNDRGNAGATMSLTAAAKAFATRLKNFSNSVQTMRSDAEAAIGTNVKTINDLTKSLALVNDQLSSQPYQNELLDHRDRIVNQLAALGDFNFAEGSNGSMTVTTHGGLALVGIGGAVTLSFNGQGKLGPQDVYSSDPTLCGVGTITANGLDLLAGNHFASGRLGALLSLRDTVLAGSQRMVDDLAAGVALATQDPAAASGKGLFLDGTLPFTATSRDDPQRVGLAQRLTLNPAYEANSSRVEDMAGTGTTDVFALITNRLANLSLETRSGVASKAAGTANVQSLVTRLVADHAAVIQQASDSADSAQVIKRNADKMFADRNGVDVNAQLADMIALQNAYASNAHVIRTLKDMFDVLNNI